MHILQSVEPVIFKSLAHYDRKYKEDHYTKYEFMLLCYLQIAIVKFMLQFKVIAVPCPPLQGIEEMQSFYIYSNIISFIYCGLFFETNNARQIHFQVELSDPATKWTFIPNRDFTNKFL